MPFLRSSARPQAVDCFFCLSASLLPSQGSSSSSSGDRKGKGRAGTKWNWRCERCGCWNIRDERGEMLSDLPAMHDASMNERSFSLRARPSSSHLPPSQTSSIFCHHCLANQTLIINILANYLPDDSDPTFPQLYASLPSYLQNLHARYPPVCVNCQPAVEDALRRSNQKGQVQALGSALQRGFSRGLQAGAKEQRVTGLDIAIWRVRGALFCLDMAAVWLSAALSVLSFDPLGMKQRMRSLDTTTLLALLALRVLSIGWLAWDPYWLRRVQSRGRAKVSGRRTWVRNMTLVYFTRLIHMVCLFLDCGLGGRFSMPDILGDWVSVLLVHRAAFAIEVMLVLHSLTHLRISQPASIQLVEPVALSTPPRPGMNHPPTIIPSQNVPPTTAASPQVNPIFGQPSLQQAQVPPAGNEPMDWEPSPGAVLNNGGWTKRPPDWDAFGVGKQRMFASSSAQDETGLETLLAGWGLGTETRRSIHSQDGQDASRTAAAAAATTGLTSKHLRTAAGVSAVALVVAASVRVLMTLDSLPRLVWGPRA